MRKTGQIATLSQPTDDSKDPMYQQAVQAEYLLGTAVDSDRTTGCPKHDPLLIRTSCPDLSGGNVRRPIRQVTAGPPPASNLDYHRLGSSIVCQHQDYSFLLTASDRDTRPARTFARDDRMHEERGKQRIRHERKPRMRWGGA